MKENIEFLVQLILVGCGALGFITLIVGAYQDDKNKKILGSNLLVGTTITCLLLLAVMK